MPRIKAFLLRLHTPIWLGILVAVVLVLRIPSFFEPYYYGDEMIYLTLGHGIRAGIPLYLGLHDNKPPLIYLLAALVGNLFWFKVALASFNVAGVIFFWKLTEALFPKKGKLQAISTIAFGILTTIPFFEGNTVNAEALMLVPTIAAFLVLFKKNSAPLNLIFAGGLFSLAALFKIPAAFEFPVIFVFWVITSKFSVKKAFYITAGFLLPVGLSFLWFFMAGAGKEYLVAAYLQNFGYVSSWRQGTFGQGNFLTNNGPLLFRGLVVLVGTSLLTLFRKKLSKPFIFACLWLLFSLFAVTISERPYPHYLIQALPAASLLLGILISDTSLEQSLTVIPLALFFLVPSFYNFWTYQTGNYYARFARFAAKKITKEEYFSKFEGATPSNYRVAEILAASTAPNEKVFVWGGDSPTIYALSRRLPPIKYIADYHVFDYSDLSSVFKEIEAKKPEFIVILPNAREFPLLKNLAQKEYFLIDNSSEVEIWTK